MYTGLRLDYRLRLWAPTFASRDISVVAELLVAFHITLSKITDCRNFWYFCNRTVVTYMSPHYRETYKNYFITFSTRVHTCATAQLLRPRRSADSQPMSVWNSLSESVRSAGTLASFERKLKIYLFNTLHRFNWLLSFVGRRHGDSQRRWHLFCKCCFFPKRFRRHL